jgi:hypothetical protein
VEEDDMKLRSAIAGAAALLAISAGQAVALPAAGNDACESPHDHDIYRMEIAPLTRTVQRGETAQVRATVHRSVNGHDLGPAEGAHVVVALTLGDFTRAGGAVTDEHGLAMVDIRLGRRFPTGWADARAHATREPADLPCHPYREGGGTQAARFLRVL